MTKRAYHKQTMIPWKLILLAGLCGGVAEVLWIALYSFLTTLSAGEVARQVTASVFPAAANLAWAPVLGVIIHLVLSLALGLVFAWLIWIPVARHVGAVGALSSAIAALIAVWAFNFFILLPALNPGFIALMPLSVTFVSKVLFGVAMAWVLLQCAAPVSDRNRKSRLTKIVAYFSHQRPYSTLCTED